jgi:hypothetical protein
MIELYTPFHPVNSVKLEDSAAIYDATSGFFRSTRSKPALAKSGRERGVCIPHRILNDSRFEYREAGFIEIGVQVK